MFPREIENNSLCKFGGQQSVLWECGSGQLVELHVMLPFVVM